MEIPKTCLYNKPLINHKFPKNFHKSKKIHLISKATVCTNKKFLLTQKKNLNNLKNICPIPHLMLN